MKCSKCNTESESTKFCPNCGGPMSSSQGGQAININVGDANIRTFEGATIVGEQHQNITHIGSQQQNITQIGSVVQMSDGKDSRNLFELGKTAFEGGSYDVADKYLIQVLERDLNNPEAWAIRGSCNGWLQRFPEGQRYLIKARQMTNQSALILYYLQHYCNSVLYLVKSAQQKAATASASSAQAHAQYLDCRSKVPTRVTPENQYYTNSMINNMNAAHSQYQYHSTIASQSMDEAKNHMKWAVEACCSIIAIDQYDFTVWNYFYEILTNSGIYQSDYLNTIRFEILKRTVEYDDACLQKQPDDINAMQHKIRALKDLGWFDQAITCYDQLLTSGFNREYITQKIDLFNKLNRYAASILCYDELIEKEPNNPQLFHGKIDLLKRMNRFPEMVQCYDCLIRLNPNDTNNWMNKGIILSNLDRLPDALQSLEQSIKVNSSNIEGYLHCGIVYEKMGKYQSACESYQIALKLDPSREDIKKQRKNCLTGWKSIDPITSANWKKQNNIGWFD